MGCEQGADAGLVEQLGCEPAGERFDLAAELALLSGQLLNTSRDSPEGEQDAAELEVSSTLRTRRAETVEQSRPSERAKFAAQWLRSGDEEIT